MDVFENVDVVPNDAGYFGLVLDVETEDFFDLTRRDRDCRSGGEPGDDGDGEELDEESELEQTEEKDDDAGGEGQQDGQLRRSVFRPVPLGVLRRHEGHDGGRPDGDVLGAAKDAVDETAHESRVEAVLGMGGDSLTPFTSRF